MNNWQVSVAGTNPTNALSSLRLLSAVPTATNATIRWQSTAGVNYFLSRSAGIPATHSLAATNFVAIATNVLGLPGITTYTDTNMVGAGPFLYRVGVGAP